MTLDSPISEQRLRNAARWIFYSTWLLFAIAAVLTVLVRHSVPARAGSLWIFGCAVVAFGLSFALRDAVRKAGHRNTEDRIVRDVQSFLERQPAEPAGQLAADKTVLKETAGLAGDAFVPSKSAGFVPLKGAADLRTPDPGPAVFDAFPTRGPIANPADSLNVIPPAPPND
jgi:hypothetical protein